MKSKAGQTSKVSPPSRGPWLVVLALMGVTLIAYLPVLNHEFLNYDDDHYVTQNPAVRLGLSREGISWAFRSSFGANWFPLTWLSWMLDYELYGLSARGFLLTNLLLHSAAVATLFAALFRMTGANGKSAFVAGVFALHPLHVESVAWVAERKDVLAGLFWMLTLLAYARYAERPTKARYAVVFSALALGLMAKPMLVTLPFVLLLLDGWPLKRLDRARAKARVLEKVPLVLLTVASSIITYAVQQSAGAVQALEQFSFRVRLLNAANAYLAYMGKTIWPRGLAVYYPHPGDSVAVLGALAGGAMLLAISILAVRTLSKRPYVFVGWFWYVGTLVPVIGLVQVGQQAMADRYTYIPLVGLSIVAAWYVGELLGARVARLAGAVVLAVLALATTAQARVWRDSKTLFEHALAVTRENSLAHSNLGVAFLNENRLEEAARHLEEAIRIHPGSAESHAALGAVRGRQGRVEEATDHFNTSLRLDPTSARTHEAFASLLLTRDDVPQALTHFREAVALDPLLAEARINLAAALLREGEEAAAIVELEKALELKPGDVKALNNMGNALASQGKFTEAVEYFREAVRRDPHDAEPHFGWGSALMSRREFKEATEHFQKALGLKPDDALVQASLGLALAHQGELDDAMAKLRRALELDPNLAQARYGLGLALANQGRLQEAIEQFRLTLVVNPKHAEALFSWGIALASLGRLAEATERFRAALEANPNYAEAENAWAMALAQMGRVDDATEHLRAAVRLDAGNPDAHNNLGAYLARQGRLKEALQSFERALALRPDDPTARANLEKTRAALGK